MIFHPYIRKMSFWRTPEEIKQGKVWWAEYKNEKMKPGNDLREHLRKMQEHVNRLKFIKNVPNHGQQFEVLLHSLPTKWSNELLLIAHERRADRKAVIPRYCIEELLQIWVQENTHNIVWEIMASFPSSYP